MAVESMVIESIYMDVEMNVPLRRPQIDVTDPDLATTVAALSAAQYYTPNIPRTRNGIHTDIDDLHEPFLLLRRCPPTKRREQLAIEKSQRMALLYSNTARLSSKVRLLLRTFNWIDFAYAGIF